jgi:hypothetical protein
VEEANGLDWPARFGTQAAIREDEIGTVRLWALLADFSFGQMDKGQSKTLRKRILKTGLHLDESRRG